MSALIASSIRLIAFDLDDTLWPCMPTIIKAEETLYDWLSKNFPLITNRYNMTSMMGMRKDFMHLHPELKVDLTQMRLLFLEHLADLCHYPKNEVAIPGLAVFMQARNTVNFYDDVDNVLKQLSKNYVVASISNGNADVKQTAVAPYIHFSANAADVQSAKPDIKLFHFMQQKAQITAEQCLYVGDDIDIDIKGARNANWDCIWLNREGKVWPSNQTEKQPSTIASLKELL